MLIDITFVGKPTIEALDKTKWYNLDQITLNGLRATATVGIMQLSLSPFETKASKILHGN